MYTKEDLESMTVADLRQIARENDIRLGSGLTKQGILERLYESLSFDQSPQSPASPSLDGEQGVRHAVTIVADDEDTPVLTPNVPYIRPGTSYAQPVQPAASPAPAPAAAAGQTVSGRGNVPGTNKPAFTLEGARAWHNPRSFQQPSTSGYSQRSGVFGSQRPAQPAYGQQRPVQRTAPAVQRFGPEAVPADPKDDPADESASHSVLQSPSEIRSSYLSSSAQPEPRHRESYAAGASALPELLASAEVTDGGGVLEIQSDGFGYLRTGNYLPGHNDIYVSPAQIRRFHLRTGDYLKGKIRPKRENETHSMLLYVVEINGIDAQDIKEPASFDSLTAVYPAKQICFSSYASDNPVLRTVDLMAPIGFGQRAMIIAPSRSGKTALLTTMASAIHAQYPEAELLSLLLGERPEDITIARDTLPGTVIYAGFDEPTENQIRIAELTLERAMRLAEQKKDVVLLIDSLTCLCRAYSECAPQHVRILPGGLAAGSLTRPKHLFGAARCLREGGSLTIVAIMLEDTGIPLDHAIAEEFRGTANMELRLNQSGQIDYSRSMTRNPAGMLDADRLAACEKLHLLAAEKGNEAFGTYLEDLMKKYADNDQLKRHII